MNFYTLFSLIPALIIMVLASRHILIKHLNIGVYTALELVYNAIQVIIASNILLWLIFAPHSFSSLVNWFTCDTQLLFYVFIYPVTLLISLKLYSNIKLKTPSDILANTQPYASLPMLIDSIYRLSTTITTPLTVDEMKSIQQMILLADYFIIDSCELELTPIDCILHFTLPLGNNVNIITPRNRSLGSYTQIELGMLPIFANTEIGDNMYNEFKKILDNWSSFQSGPVRVYSIKLITPSTLPSSDNFSPLNS